MIKVKDSGERQIFDTGSKRDTNINKGRFDLIPSQMMFRLARHYEAGAVKYDDRNWEKGQPVSRCLDSCLRHIEKYKDGWNDEDHLSAAIWNLAAIIHFEKELPKMQDLPMRKDLYNPFLIEREMWEEEL